MQVYLPVSCILVDDINKSPVSSMRILSFNKTNKSIIVDKQKIKKVSKFLNNKNIPPKIQVVFGLGAPITLQDNITSFPSRTVEF